MLLQRSHSDMANETDKQTNGDAIDDNLKRVYDDMLSQEVPDRFKDLLAQLKGQDAKAEGEDDA